MQVETYTFDSLPFKNRRCNLTDSGAEGRGEEYSEYQHQIDRLSHDERWVRLKDHTVFQSHIKGQTFRDKA